MRIFQRECEQAARGVKAGEEGNGSQAHERDREFEADAQSRIVYSEKER